MTREEAILLSAYTGFLLVQDFSAVHKFCEDTLGRSIWTHEFADEDVQKEIQDKLRPQIMKLIYSTNALRPVSRDQVEKAWRGEWRLFDDCANEGLYCSQCGKKVYRVEYANVKMATRFCPNCMSAMTDKAVDMVMERLEAMNREDN